MGFNECEAALRLFVLGEDPASVARRLTYDPDTVCLRYVNEQVVSRADVERLALPGPTPHAADSLLRKFARLARVSVR